MARGVNAIRAALAACLLLESGWALAAPPRSEKVATAVFAVARDPSGQKAASAMGALLRTQTRYHRRLRLIEPARVLAGDPKTREEETLERAQTALADGRRAYDALSLDDAIARLGQAVSLYQQTGPLLGDLSEMKTALAYLGSALTLRGSAEEGVSTFLELLTIDPAYGLSEAPPAVQGVFDRALRQLETESHGSVELYSTPPYAAVFLDGDFRGVTPLTLEDLSAGTHYLRLEKDGYVVHGAPLEIAPKQRITSQTRLRSIQRGAELRDLLSRSAQEVMQDGVGTNLRNLGRLLVSDMLVVVSVSQSGRDLSFTGSVYDASAAIKLATERAVVGADALDTRQKMSALVNRLLSVAAEGVASSGARISGGGGLGLDRGAGVGATPPPGEPPPPVASGGLSGDPNLTLGADAPGEDPAMKTGTIIGISVAGFGGACLITGVVFGSLSLATHGDYLDTPQNSPDLADIRDDGKKKALLADVFYGVGVASVIGGGLLILVTEAQRPTPAELLGEPTASIVPVDGGAIFTIGGSL